MFWTSTSAATGANHGLQRLHHDTNVGRDTNMFHCEQCSATSAAPSPGFVASAGFFFCFRHTSLGITSYPAPHHQSMLERAPTPTSQPLHVSLGRSHDTAATRYALPGFWTGPGTPQCLTTTLCECHSSRCMCHRHSIKRASLLQGTTGKAARRSTLASMKHAMPTPAPGLRVPPLHRICICCCRAPQGKVTAGHLKNSPKCP
jgi:hypothetical protein